MADDRVSLEIEVKSDSKEVDSLSQAIEELQQTVSKSTGQIKDLGKSAKTAGDDMKKAEKSTKKLDTGLKGLAKSAVKAVVAFKGFKMLGKYIKEGIGKAADYQESVHLFNVIFGKIGAEAGDAFNKEMWARLEKNQDRFLTLGLDPDTMLEGQGIFASIADAAGVANEATLDISEGLSMLAADYSAFRNISIEDSMSKFHSGITGQIKSLRMFGIEVSMNELQAEALRHGIHRTTAEMSQADKIQLRYLAIMRQGSVAMGDMAITAMSPANSFRILKTQIAEAGRALGTIFIPMIKAVMPYLIAMTRAVVRLFQAIAKLFGYKPPKIGAEPDMPSTGGGVSAPSVGRTATPPVGGDIGGQNKKAKKLKKTIKEIRNVLMGFDELNILPELPDDPDIDDFNSPGIGGGGGGGGLGDLGLEDLDLSDAIAEWTQKIQDIWDENLAKLKLPGWDNEMFDRLRDSANGFKDALLRLGEVIGGYFASVWETVMKPIGLWTLSEVVPRVLEYWAEIINLLADILEAARPAFDWFLEKILVPLGQWTGEVVIFALDMLIDLLGKLRTWVSENEEVVQILLVALGLLGVALFAISHPAIVAVVAIGWIISTIKDMKENMGFARQSTDRLSAVFRENFDNMAKLLKSIWDSVFKRVFDFLIKIIQDVIDIIKELWEKYADPIFENLGIAFTNTVDIISDMWFKILEPIWSTFMDVLDMLWDDHFKPLIKNIGEFVLELIDAGLDIYNKFVAPVMGFIIDLLAPTFRNGFQTILNVAGDLIGGIADIAGGIIDLFKGIVKFIRGVFTGDLDMAMEGINAMFKGSLKILVTIFKTPINAVISLFNGLFSGITEGMNFIARGLNKLSFKIPGWVPGIGGNEFGMNVKERTPWKIPKLAGGGLVDEGQMFIAREAGAEMVGKHGRKTAVMNNDQIVDAVSRGVAQAVSSVMGDNQNQSPHVTVKIGESTIADVLSSEINRQSRINGRATIKV